MPLVLEGELQDPTFFENNELVIDEEPLLEEKQVEKEHPELIVENVLVGVKDFNFAIESLLLAWMRTDKSHLQKNHPLP